MADPTPTILAEVNRTAPEPTFRPKNIGNTSDNLTSEQFESGARALQKHWSGDKQRLANALQGAGLEEVDDPVPPDASAEDRAIERTFGGARPQDYDLNGLYVGRSFDGIGAFEGASALDTTLRSALAEMQFPARIGRGVAESIIEAAETWQKLPDDQAEVYSAHQVDMAVRATKAGSREAMMAVIKPVIDKMDRETATTLAEAGVFENGNVLAQIYMAGRRMAARGGK